MKPLYMLAERIQSLAAQEHQTELSFLENALSTILDWGFKSVRYYETTRNPLTADTTFILRHALYVDPEIRVELGLRIEMAHSTIGTSGEKLPSIVVSSAQEAVHLQTKWVEALHLRDQRWADIAIRDHMGQLSGLLVLSKPISTEFSKEELPALRSLQIAFQHYYLAARLRQVSTLHAQLQRELKSNDDNSLPHTILNCISAILPAHSVVLFEYEWSTQMITKTLELIDGVAAPIDSPPEQYGVGKSITGKAWTVNGPRLIPDFDLFCKESRIVPPPEVIAFYKRTIGTIRTAVYNKIERNGRQFLVRLFNRSDKPELPFSNSHHELLELISGELEEYIDDISNRTTLGHIRALSQTAAHSTDNINRAIAIALTALDHVGCRAPALLYKKARAPRLETIPADPSPALADSEGIDLGLTLNVAISDWLEQGAPTVRDFPLASLKKEQNSILSYFKDAGCVHVIGFVARGELGHVVALLGVHRPEVTASYRPGNDMEPSVLDTIISVLSILCSALEVSRSTISVDYTEELMAHFGHEVVTPIATLQSLAIAGMNAAIKHLFEIGRFDLLDGLEAKKARIDNQAIYIRQHMDSARALARHSNGTISVIFDYHPLRQIITHAWEEAMDWRRENLDQVSYRNVELVRNDTLANVVVLGDAQLLRNIFTNLFKNAIKYSFPKTEDGPIEVHVYAEPQINMDIIHIDNWGIGISQFMKEAIFGKFIREERNDRVRAIRGMGLGLYIARLYAIVHNSELYCAYSKPDFKDPERIARLEGFSTRFDLRIPKHGRKPGTHTVVINERK